MIKSVEQDLKDPGNERMFTLAREKFEARGGPTGTNMNPENTPT